MQKGLAKGFATQRLNPFPVRAAVDIGTGGAVTVTTARVDVRAGAIQEVLQHAVLPLDLDWVGHGVLDPACWPRVTAQVRTAAGYVQRSRPTEFAGIVNLPVTGASEAVRLWRRELKMPLHFLFADGPSPGDEVASAHDPVFDVRSPFFAWDGTQTEGGAARQSVGDERSDALVFAAAAAAARCLDPTSMVLLRETADALRLSILVREPSQVKPAAVPRAEQRKPDAPHITTKGDALPKRNGRTTAGMARPPQQPQQARANSSLIPAAASSSSGFGRVTHVDLPLHSKEAHRLLVRELQRRPAAGPSASPNPVTREEYGALRRMVSGTCGRALPEAVVDVIARNGPVVALGGNGSVWNIAARACGYIRPSASLVDGAARHKLCGATDVVLAHNYPNPHLVVPQLALFVGLCEALHVARVEYCPDVGLTHAMLVDPGFWAAGRFADIVATADRASLEQRVHTPPRERFDPHRVNDGDRVAHAPKLEDDERQWFGGN